MMASYPTQENPSEPRTHPALEGMSQSLDDAWERGLIDRLDVLLIERLLRLAPTTHLDLLRQGLLALAQSIHQGSVRVSVTGDEWKTFREALATGKWDPLIGKAGEYKPVVFDDNALYTHQTFTHETDIAARLLRLSRPMDSNLPSLPSIQVEQALQDILQANPLRNSQGLPLDFTGTREAALRRSLTTQFMVISGGPGTGKTSLCTNLLRLHRRLFGPDLRIALAAPTGRAAQRLVESLRQTSIRELDDLEATTLHRLLAYDVGHGKFRYRENLPLPFDLLVIDEASMMDMQLFRALLRAMSPSTRLILLGDRDQLPSVAAGSLLVDLGPIAGQSDASAAIPWVTLTGSHRSHPDLVRASQLWMQGELSAFLNDTPIHFDSQWRSENKASWEKQIHQWFQAQAPQSEWLHALAAYEPESGSFPQGHQIWTAEDERFLALQPLFQWQARSQMLAILRQGPEGVSGLNALARQYFQSQWDPRSNDERFFHGAPLQILQNDFGRGLANGDTGLAIRWGGQLYAAFRNSQQVDLWPISLLAHADLAFATTVHKAQGSEYDHVFLVLPPPEHPLLNREVVYTALTRAKKSVSILGAEAALGQAAQKNLVRTSGLKKRLCG